MSDLMMDVMTNPQTSISNDVLEREDALYHAVDNTKWLTAASANVHRLARHFFRDINTGKPIERNTGELIALMHSELSEMLEGVRKNAMDSHLPLRRAEEVELADLIIRALDYAAYRKLDISAAVREKLQYNASRKDHTDEARRAVHGKKF